VPPRSLRRLLLPTAPFVAAVLIAVAPLRAADPPPVLLVVPAGSDVARVEAARASVPSSRALLTVGATERVALREGVELLADRSFSDAPPCDLVVVLPGEAAGEEAFLVARRRTARVILFLGDSPLLRRLKGDGSRGALILVGGPETVKALIGAQTPAPPEAAAAPSSETPRATEVSPPRPTAAPQASPTPPASAVRRYFSARSPTPTSPPSGPPR
jgi:hypothetical protein